MMTRKAITILYFRYMLVLFGASIVYFSIAAFKHIDLVDQGVFTFMVFVNVFAFRKLRTTYLAFKKNLPVFKKAGSAKAFSWLLFVVATFNYLAYMQATSTDTRLLMMF